MHSRKMRILMGGVVLFGIIFGVMGCVPETEESGDEEFDFSEDSREESNQNNGVDDHEGGEEYDLESIDDCAGGEWPQPWLEREAQIIGLVNDVRAEGAECNGVEMEPVEALIPSDPLVGAARCHAVDMGTNAFLAHEGSDGRDEVARAIDAGYSSSYVGENVARGFEDPERLIEALLDSPGHCRNLMHADYEEIGVGYIEVDDRGYWSQKFGAP